MLALVLGTMFSAALLLGAPVMFRWMGGRDEMLSDALAYANVALGGAVCISVLNLLLSASPELLKLAGPRLERHLGGDA